MDTKHLVTVFLLLLLIMPSCSDNDKNIEERKADFSVYINGDIESLNIETGEIVFQSGEILHELSSSEPFGLSSTVTFYINNEPVLELVPIQPMYSSKIYNELVLVVEDAKCYLLDGYPSVESLGENQSAGEELRKENAEKRKANWERFVSFLEGEGKIIVSQ